MSEKRSLSNLPHRLRDELQALPEHLRDWTEALRRDPASIAHSPITRLAMLGAGGIAAVLAIGWLAAGLVPAPSPGSSAEATPWATLYVACTNSDCRSAYQTQTEMDFDAWPLRCESCGHEAVYRAQRCPKCRQWFAIAPGQPRQCPRCAQSAPPPDTNDALHSPAPRRDDREDPW